MHKYWQPLRKTTDTKTRICNSVKEQQSMWHCDVVQLQINHIQNDLRVMDLRHNCFFLSTEVIVRVTYRATGDLKLHTWQKKSEAAVYATSRSFACYNFTLSVVLGCLCVNECVLSSSCQYNCVVIVEPAGVCLLGERPIVTSLCSQRFFVCSFFFSFVLCLFLSSASILHIHLPSLL